MELTKKKVFSIALIITLANIIGKILGFVKDVLISYYYGASAMTDAVFLAMSIPLLILGVFTSSTDSSIIPQFNRISIEQGRDEAEKNFSNIVNSILAISFFISLLVLFYPRFFINIFAPGFNEEQTKYAMIFLKYFSFFGFMHILYCYFSTYNTIFSRVVPRAVLSFTTNLLVVISLILYPDPNMKMLSIAFLVGNVLTGVIPVISAVKNDYKHKWIGFQLTGEVRQYIKVFFPIMGVALLANLHLFVDKFIASNMSEGSISYLNYASRLTSVFDSMIVVGLGVVILPVLSLSRANKDFLKFNKNATQVVKLLLILLIPITALCMITSYEIIDIVYRRGEFGESSVIIVSSVFLCYAPQILGLPLQATLSRIFHSIEDTRTPFKINFVSVIMNIILSVILSINFGIIGISIATSFSIILSSLLLLWRMIKCIGWDSSVFNLRDIYKIFLNLLISMSVAYLLMNLFTGSFNRFIVAAVSGAIMYLIFLSIFLRRDFKYMLSFIINR